MKEYVHARLRGACLVAATEEARRQFALDTWSPEQVALGRTWVNTWRATVPRLEAIRRRELRELDATAAVGRERFPGARQRRGTWPAPQVTKAQQ
jgi:hypothetical protein